MIIQFVIYIKLVLTRIFYLWTVRILPDVVVLKSSQFITLTIVWCKVYYFLCILLPSFILFFVSPNKHFKLQKNLKFYRSFENSSFLLKCWVWVVMIFLSTYGPASRENHTSKSLHAHYFSLKNQVNFMSMKYDFRTWRFIAISNFNITTSSE